MSWELVKDISELAGTVGTAMAFFVHYLVRETKRDVLMNEKVQKMQENIERMEQTKANRDMTDAHHAWVRDELLEMRTDIKEGNERTASNIEQVNKSISNLEGTVRTFMQFIKPNN